MKQNVWRQGVLALGVLFFFLATSPALAEVKTVAPGNMVFFSQAENGKRECLYSSASVDVPVKNCLGYLTPPWIANLPPYTNTSYNLKKNRVSAAYSNAYVPDPTNALSPAHYASSAIYNDFKIDNIGNTDNFVDAQVSVAYDLFGGILGGFGYDAEMSLTLSIEDITDPDKPLPIGTMELFKKDRSGDQGLTDVAMGATQVSLKGETARFQVKLQRGKSYRIWFTAGAFATTPLISGAEVTVSAKWTKLSVGIDEDENIAEMLVLHDTEMKNTVYKHDDEIKAALAAHDQVVNMALAEHDLKINAALATHDQEVKALLVQVQGQLAEIKKLLLTPQGRRPGFPLKSLNPKSNK